MVSTAAWAVLGLSWMIALGWLWAAASALRGMRTLPDLTRMDVNALPALETCSLPHITVVVPACNEEEAIEGTLRSLLGSTGVRLQIIAVDDRSTDRTGERMEAVAREALTSGSGHRLQVIRNRELPDGWLGKPHALHLALQQAEASWFLFTDADVRFAPDALERALRHALAERADHLVLVPTMIRKSLGESAMIANLQAPLAWALRPWKVSDPDAKDFIGVGGFNLVRAEAYAQVGGFEALRMEVIEDMGLGWRMKQARLRSRVALGPNLVRIHWIAGFTGIVGNIEKNAFASMRYKLARALAVCFGLGMQIVVPLLALSLGPWGWAACLLTYAGVALVMRANRGLNGVGPWAVALYAPAMAVIWWATVRSIVLTVARRGVVWRGTLYPLAELRRQAQPWW